MKISSNILKCLEKFIDTCSNDSRYKISPTCFTRNRKMTFKDMVFFLLNLPKRSLTVELDEYSERIKSHKNGITKSGFSQQRYNLKHQLFIDLNKFLVEMIYTLSTELKKWRGKYVYGIDGSLLYLFDKYDMEDYFGLYHGKVMGRSLIVEDVLNNICISSSLSPIATSEALALQSLFSDLANHKNKVGESLFIYDRNFPSFFHFFKHNQLSLDYLMRCKTGFNKEVKSFVNSGKDQEIVCLYPCQTDSKLKKKLKEEGYCFEKNEGILVRLIRVELKSGQIEVLITNLLDEQQYPIEDFKALYFTRWGTETKFDCFKNKMQIECFCAHKAEGVLQEYYAQIVTVNILEILAREVDTKLEKKHAKTKKHPATKKRYPKKVNRNVSIGNAKYKIPLLLISKHREKTINELQKKMFKYTIPIIKGREFERDKKVIKTKGKYKTLTNYRRAI